MIDDKNQDKQEIAEAFFIKKKQVIRDNKKIIKNKRQYAQECPAGYKHGTDGTCVKMGAEETRLRKKAGKKAHKNPMSNIQRKKSMEKRKNLINT